jgi:telomerase reverse transcriptase
MKANLGFVIFVPDTIKTMVDVAFVLLTSKVRREQYPGYVCFVRKAEVAW